MTYRIYLTPSFVLAAILTVALTFMGGPAHADGGRVVADDYFDSAQEALGLSPQNARELAADVSVAADEDGGSVSLGAFAVGVTASDDARSKTTVLRDGVRVMSLLTDGEDEAQSRSPSLAAPRWCRVAAALMS